MQTEHLFELTYILLEKKCVTASEMAEHFGVSTRTIYRWVDALSLSGVPIYCTKGKGGGIRLSEKYALDKTVFTETEKFELLSSVQAFSALSGSKNTALTKLKTLTNNHANWIQIDFAPWNTKMVQIRDLFNVIKNAILTQTQICFDYYSAKGLTKNRVAEPWKIVFKGQAWYLYGFCNTKNEPRFFKLSRIENLQVLNSSNTHNARDYVEQAESGYDESFYNATAEKITLKLQIKDNELYRILDEYKIENIEKACGAESSVITMQMPNFPWLVYWVLSFGSAVKVLEPKALRKEVHRIAKEILEQ